MNALTAQRRIEAPPTTVFAFLVERQKLLRWFGVDATLDPRVGGPLRIQAAPDISGDHWRGVDLLSPVRHLQDLTRRGRGDWMPRVSY